MLPAAPLPRPARVTARGPWLLLALPAAVLLLAVALQLLPQPRSTVVPRALPLAEFFPAEVAGWTGEDSDLGETEAVKGRVKKLLNYDEILFRTYRRSGREFSLYVAYWLPGKMPAREIAYHVPDKCWVTAGWQRTAADTAYTSPVPGLVLAPGQYREFRCEQQLQHVVYWHIFDGRAITYNPGGTPSDFSKLSDLFNLGVRQKGEQYFIRVTSPVPFPELWPEDGFQQIMDLLGALGPGRTTTLLQLDRTAR